MNDTVSDPGDPPIPLRAIGARERAPDPVLELLKNAFEAQTNAIVAEMHGLSKAVMAMGTDLRAEARSTRLWMAGLIGLALIILGGIVGVSVNLDLKDRTVQTTVPTE